MTASRIVEALDEGEHCASRLGLRLEPAAIEQFAFEGREEALAHGVVIGITDRTHRGSHTCLTTAVAELDRGVLPGLKWSSQHFEGEVAMTGRRRRSDRSGRAPLFSPGRPVVAGRDRARRYACPGWATTSSKTATPNHVLWVIPGDRNELVECHSEAGVDLRCAR